MFTRESKSPYLRDPNRLGDVIAAVQAMAIYKIYKLTFEDWSDRISGNKSKADYWRTVFEEHPEFFRLDGERLRASLVWRRQYPKWFHIDEVRRLSRDELSTMSEEYKRKHVSRNPLTSDDIKALIDTAINLHSRALEEQREKRWWLPLASAVGALVGAVIGGLLKGTKPS